MFYIVFFQSPIRSILDKEMAKKTWSSLPKSEFLTVNRHNSVGSLDRNFGGGVSIHIYSAFNGTLHILFSYASIRPTF